MTIAVRVPAALLAGVLFVPPPDVPGHVEILDATGGLPAHIAGRFTDPVAFAEASSGEFIVLDRRKHTVFGVDRAQTRVRTIIEIGVESGKLLQPAAFSLANDLFAVADAPGGLERVQYFTLKGQWIGGFHLPTRVQPRLVLGSLVLNGVGSLQFTGETFLLNRPEDGALVDELNNQGHVVRRIGALRPTGHEGDRDVHVALNIAVPLRDAASGGYYVVFRTGRPMFRKYNAAGELEFERHIEGVELDAGVRTLPTVWPKRDDASHLPLMAPLVRTAAVDPEGRLWVSLMEPYTYVYDRRGDKVRTVQFRGARVLAASSLFFAGPDRLLITPGCYEFKVQ